MPANLHTPISLHFYKFLILPGASAIPPLQLHQRKAVSRVPPGLGVDSSLLPYQSPSALSVEFPVQNQGNEKCDNEDTV